MVYKSQNPFSFGLSLVQNKKNLYGYINTKGEEVIACQYKYASNFYNGVVIVGNKNKKGIINTEGKIIFPLEYEDIHFTFFNTVILTTTKGKMGAANISGEWFITPNHDQIIEVGKCLWAIQANNAHLYILNRENLLKSEKRKYKNFSEAENFIIITDTKNKDGLLDAEGNILVECIYPSLVFFGNDDNNNAYFVAKQKNKLGLINQNGHLIIPFEYAYITQSDKKTCILVGKGKTGNELFGVIDFQNNILIPLIYNSIGDFLEDTFWAIENIRHNNELESEYSIINLKNKNLIQNLKEIALLTPEIAMFKRKKVGLIHPKTFEIILKETYNEISFAVQDDADKVFLYIKKNNYYGIMIAETQTEILSCVYLNIMVNSDFTFIVQNKNKKFGIVDNKNNIVLACEYEDLFELRSEQEGDFIIFAAKKDKYSGVIDSKSNIILPFEYDEILYVDWNERKIEALKGKWIKNPYKMIKNPSTELETTEILKDNLEVFQDEKTELFGFQNDKKQIVLPAIYQYVWGEFCGGFCVVGEVKKAGEYYKMGLINTEGTLIVPYQYNSLEYLSENLFVFQDKKEKFGVLEVQKNKEYRELVTAKYDYVRIHQGYCLAAFKKQEKSCIEVIYKDKKTQSNIISKTIIAEFHYELGDMGVKIKNQEEYWGFMNLEGKIIVPCEYQEIHNEFSEGLIGVMSNGYWGFADENNHLQIPCEYVHEVTPFEKGKAFVYDYVVKDF
ncbi:MAG: WG repeat-containing protein [Bacteroidetes bacterium]|nr:MAG: WG repeat-containing protein [Bacteroidota bacterium]